MQKQKNNLNIQKILSVFVLSAIITSSLGSLFFPARASAQLESLFSPSVPVSGDGGGFDSITWTGIDATAFSNEIVKSIVNSEQNDFFRKLGIDMTKDLEEKLRIKNPLYYDFALTDQRYLDAQRRILGDDVVEPGKDLVKIFRDYQDLALNKTYTPKQVEDLAILRSRASTPATASIRDREIKKLILGATSMFTSSISCAGIDGKALKNTAKYLAVSSAGVLAREIDPRGGVKYYEDLAKINAPFSTPPFWQLALQDNSSRLQSDAARAAALEQTGSGIKSPQNTDPKGYLEIGKSQNLITNSQSRALASAFDSALRGGNAGIGKGNWSDFTALLLKIYTEGEIIKNASTLGNKLGKTVGKLLGSLVKLLGGSGSSILLAKSYGHLVAKEITKTFVKALYDKALAMVFQGSVLGENSRCRSSRTTTDLKTDVNTNVTPSTTEAVIFEVSPSSIIKSDTDGKVHLIWDLTGYTNPTVKIDKVGEGYLSNVSGASGAVDDTIDVTNDFELNNCKDRNKLEFQCQEYRLEINTTEKIISRLVTIYESPGKQAVDFSGVTFDVQPKTLTKSGPVTVTWDATSVDGAKVGIYPVSTGELATSGSQTYTVDKTTTFTMTTTAPSGETNTKEIVVTLTSGTAAGAFTSQLVGLKPRE